MSKQIDESRNNNGKSQFDGVEKALRQLCQFSISNGHHSCASFSFCYHLNLRYNKF